MIKIILPIIIIFVQTSKLTSQIISGTIVFGGIAKEGIIFVADSRVTHSINFIDQFYFDNVAKIHIIDNYVVGLSGNTSISNYEIEYYLDKIKNIKFSSKEEIIKHIHNLILVDTNFDITKKHDFKILIGGYNNFLDKMDFTYFSNGEITMSINENIEIGEAINLNLEHTKNTNYKKLIRKVKKKIKQKVIEKNLSNKVGGPFSVYFVEKGKKPKCVENCNMIYFYKRSDYKKYLLQNEKIITPLVNKSKKELITQMD